MTCRLVWIALLSVLSAAEPQVGTLHVTIHGVESTSGQMLLVLFDRPEGFPDEPSKAARAAIVSVTQPTTSHVFRDLPPGTYAGFAVHDEDGNGKVDTRRIIPIPIEPVGASRGARARFGPPKFEDAKFSVAVGDNHEAITLVRL